MECCMLWRVPLVRPYLEKEKRLSPYLLHNFLQSHHFQVGLTAYHPENDLTKPLDAFSFGLRMGLPSEFIPQPNQSEKVEGSILSPENEERKSISM